MQRVFMGSGHSVPKGASRIIYGCGFHNLDDGKALDFITAGVAVPVDSNDEPISQADHIAELLVDLDKSIDSQPVADVEDSAAEGDF